MKLLLSYTLFIFAGGLFLVIGFFTFSVSVIVSLLTFTAPKFFKELAIGIDRLGNVLIAPLANYLLKTKEGYKFGKGKETISSALGKNQQFETLSSFGKSIAWILDTIDKDHCKKSIDYGVDPIFAFTEDDLNGWDSSVTLTFSVQHDEKGNIIGFESKNH